MNAKTWLIIWIVFNIVIIIICGYLTYKIDPYFHFRKPETDKYFYLINNERSQNDGIMKYFDYDAIICGTSMLQNTRASEFDRLFGCKSIKINFSGGSFREINDNIEKALSLNPNIKYVVRCLDADRWLNHWDFKSYYSDPYPVYLTDNNAFNDIEYLLNRDVVFGRLYKMIVESKNNYFPKGITSFDDYEKWQDYFEFGFNTVSKAESINVGADKVDDKLNVIKENIEYNVLRTVEKYPNVEFYYFFSPYSAAFWYNSKLKGELYLLLKAEKYITELLINHKNLHLFSFNYRTDIISDLNNYKDTEHYGIWINSLINKWLHEGTGELTVDNYKERLEKEYEFFTTFDISSIANQIDYEADYYAGALLNKELTGVSPLDVLLNIERGLKIERAEYRIINGKPVIDCNGFYTGDVSTSPIENNMLFGVKFNINLDEGYNYLCFNFQNITGTKRLTVTVYDENNKIVSKYESSESMMDKKSHQCAMDLSTINGNVTIVLNGEGYQISDLYMY